MAKLISAALLLFARKIKVLTRRLFLQVVFNLGLRLPCLGTARLVLGAVTSCDFKANALVERPLSQGLSLVFDMMIYEVSAKTFSTLQALFLMNLKQIES